MKEKKKSILIALSFIIALFLFIWGFNFLKGKSILRNQLNFYAVYNNTKGLLPGDIVTINGMSVGTVTSTKFHPKKDGSIVVSFTINNDLNIPVNSVVNLSSSLMGSVNLDLILGNSNIVAKNGDTLNAGYDNGTMGMIEEQIIPLKNEVETLLTSLNELATNINGLIDNKFKENIDKSASDLANSMNNINDISYNIKTLIDSEKGKISSVVDNLENITNNFNTISDSLSKINYSDFVYTAELCLTELNTLVEGLNNGDGTAGLLIKDDSLYYNVNETIITLQYILEEIKANPKKIKLSVF